MKAQLIIHQLLRAFVLTAVVSAVPLAAEDRDSVSIQAALAGKDYSRAVTLTKQAFAGVKSPKDAAVLLRSILSSTPVAEDSPLVIAAIEGNPSLLQTILSTVVASVSKEEASTILSEVYVSLVKDANPGLIALANRIAEASSEVLTMPTFNPANTVGVAVTLSPSTPGARP